MICKTHNLSIVAVCLRCKIYLCIHCMLEAHNQHLQSITLKNNIILTIHNIISILKELEIIFQENPEKEEILKFIQKNREIYQKKLEKVLLNDQVYFSLQFFIEVMEKIVLKSVNSLYLINLNLEDKQTQTAKSLILNKITQENEIYKKIKSFDMYYILLKYGVDIKSIKAYKQQLLRQINKEILFKAFLESMTNENNQYQEQENDDHFRICLGRNYYLIGQYEKCVAYMEGFDQNEEAKIYIALSNIFLKKEGIAIAQFDQLKHISKYKDLILFSQGHALELIGDKKQAVTQYEMLYQKHQNQMVLTSICDYLYENGQNEKLSEICDQSIEEDPKNSIAWTYKSINSSRSPYFDQDIESIADYLINLQPSDISGYILKGAYLIQENQFEEAFQISNLISQKFPNNSFWSLMKSFSLFIQQKYTESYDIFKDIPIYFFTNNLDKLHLEIMILMKSLNLSESRKNLFQNYEDSKLFYLISNEFCDHVKTTGTFDQVVFLLKGYKNEIQQNQLGFYHILKGRLLFFKGKQFKQIQLIEKALKHFTNYQYDSCGLPYVKYYLGEALLNLNRLNEAVQQFEEALDCPNSFWSKPYYFLENIFKCKLIQGEFKEALKYHQLAKSLYKLIDYDLGHNILLGMSLFVEGQNEQAYTLLNQESSIIPLIYFFLSWILKEQNQKDQAEQLLSQLNQQSSQLQLFIQKYTFLSTGPYSSYIQNNQEKFNTYDDKTFYAIKFIAFYFETWYCDFSFTKQEIILPALLIFFLSQFISKSNFQLKTELMKSYHFV